MVFNTLVESDLVDKGTLADGAGEKLVQNRSIELLHESQINWEKFCVLGFYAQFCRFKEEFLTNLETLTTYYPPLDFTFYRVDVEKFIYLLTLYQVQGTPAILCIYTPRNIKKIYHGNYAPIQICALINMLLDNQ